MPYILPVVPSIPNYRVRTTFGGQAYLFDLLWNARDAAWYFDLLKDDGTPIAHGVKIVLGVHLGRRRTHRFFRDNVIVAFDTGGKSEPPGLDDLGTRVVLARYSWYEAALLKGLL